MNNPPDFIRQFWRTVWRWIIRFMTAWVQPPPPLRKNRRRGVCGGRGRLYTGQSQTDNPFLALVWKLSTTKCLCPVFLNDSEGLYRTTVYCRCLVCRPHYSSRQMRFGSRVRAFFFSRIRHQNTLNEISWEDDVQGLGMAMSTVASEKNRELLFTSNVFYKQWHLCVLFH